MGIDIDIGVGIGVDLDVDIDAETDADADVNTGFDIDIDNIGTAGELLRARQQRLLQLRRGFRRGRKPFGALPQKSHTGWTRLSGASCVAGRVRLRNRRWRRSVLAFGCTAIPLGASVKVYSAAIICPKVCSERPGRKRGKKECHPEISFAY